MSDVIDVGSAPNDGTGDDFRTAMIKANAAWVADRSQLASVAARIGSSPTQTDIEQALNGLAPIFETKLDKTDPSIALASQSDAAAGTATTGLMTPDLTRRQIVAQLASTTAGTIGAAVAPVVALGLVRAAIPNVAIPILAFTVSGYAAAGDAGGGAVYVRGSSSGLAPIQDKAGTWWSLSPNQAMRPEFFGGLGSGDHSAAFSLAMAAAASATAGAGGTVWATNGAGYNLTNLTVPNGLALVGGGSTPIACTATGGACVTLIGDNAALQGFRVTRTGTGGTVVGVQMGAGEQGQAQRATDNTFIGFDTAIDVQSGVAGLISRNNIRASKTYGIRMRNLVNSDAGDWTIDDNTISNSGLSYGSAGIRYESGGGLRISNNKILSFDYGIDQQFPDGSATVDLLITTNSIENQHIGCVRTGRSGTTGSLSTVTITANELAGAPVGYAAGIGTSNITYTANAHNLLSTAAVTVGDGVEPIVIDKSNTYVACAATVIDNRTGYGAARIDYDFARTFANASRTTWLQIARLVVPFYRGAEVSIVAEGILQGAGAFAISQRFLLAREGGNMIATPGTALTYGQPVDIGFDVTSVPGSAIAQIKRNASDSAGGSEIDGTLTLRLTGGRLSGFYPM